VSRRIRTTALIGCAVALTAVITVACGRSASTPQSASAQPAAPDYAAAIPAQLAVPAGQELVASLNVDHGSQVYLCVLRKWTLKEPAAVLKAGDEEFLHTVGP